MRHSEPQRRRFRWTNTRWSFPRATKSKNIEGNRTLDRSFEISLENLKICEDIQASFTGRVRRFYGIADEGRARRGMKERHVGSQSRLQQMW